VVKKRIGSLLQKIIFFLEYITFTKNNIFSLLSGWLEAGEYKDHFYKKLFF